MRRQLFAVLFSIAVLLSFSSVAFAQAQANYPKKAKVASRKVVEAAPKRKIPAEQKRIATASELMVKKSVRKVAIPKKAKARAASKKRVGWNPFWKFASNPFIMPIWIALFITGLAIVDRIFWKRREPEVSSTVVEEKAEEDIPSWDQKLWDRIKEIFRKLRKKPALETC